MTSRITASSPAYRATLLLIKRGGTKSRLISLFLLESFLTKLISNLPKKTGKRIGQRAEKRADLGDDLKRLFSQKLEC